MAKKKTVKKAVKKISKKVTKKVAKKAPAKPVKKSSKKAATKKQSAAVIQSGIPQVGEYAPDFKLMDQEGSEISLKDLRGLNVVLYFYPRALTPGCTVQACGLRDSESKLKDEEVVVLGISGDPVKKLKQFQEKHQLNFKLLSDPEHKVAEAYGSWGLKKFMGRRFMGILRQTFLIDKEGKILHVMHKVDTKTHHQTVLEFFKHRG